MLPESIAALYLFAGITDAQEVRRAGESLADPHELAERIRDTDKMPSWIPGAFPTILQNEAGDAHRYQLKNPI